MTKIYTPEEWLSLFGGSAILFIDDEGYIYTKEDYLKTIGRCPCGKINYEKGYIYGKDYNSVWPTPIAEMVKKGEVTEVYRYGDGILRSPILYIKNDKIYSRDEYFRVFGGNASGYIKRDPVSKPADSKGKTSTSTNNAGGSTAGSPGGGFAAVLGMALIGGLIYILSSEERVVEAIMTLAIWINIGAGIFFLYKLVAKKSYLGWDKSRFFKGLVSGVAAYVLGTALFILLGLVSNVGTGHAVSDSGGDSLELAAMIIGIPFVLNGFLCDGPKTAGKNSSSQQWSNKTNGTSANRVCKTGQAAASSSAKSGAYHSTETIQKEISSYGAYMSALEQLYILNGKKKLSQSQVKSFIAGHRLGSRFGITQSDVEKDLSTIAKKYR